MQEHLQGRIEEEGVLQVSHTRKLLGMSTCHLGFRMSHHEIAGPQIEIQAVQVWVFSRGFQDIAFGERFQRVRILGCRCQLFLNTAARRFGTCFARGLVHVQPRGALLG